MRPSRRSTQRQIGSTFSLVNIRHLINAPEARTVATAARKNPELEPSLVARDTHEREGET
jgi:hypothetical protein